MSKLRDKLTEELGERFHQNELNARLVELIEALQGKVDRLETFIAGDYCFDSVEGWRADCDDLAPEADEEEETHGIWVASEEDTGRIPPATVAPKQTFSCSRCNMLNEYQDGPFTCHGCKS